MNKILRVLCLALALLLFAAMAMGSGSSEDEKEIVAGNNSTNNGNNSTNNGNNSTNNGNNSTNKQEITIEEQVLLDRDGIKITAKNYVDDSIWGEGIKVLIENTSNKNIGVSCNALIVNNYMITDLFSSSVAAGKKANETIYLLSSELEAAGIDTIGQIELYFHIYDSDSYATLFDADAVTIKTSAFPDMDVTPADSGTEFYNKGGIRIVGKFVDENSFWGTAVLLYLENNSGKNVSVSCDNMSINGFMMSPFFSSTIYNGKMAIDEIIIFSTDLEENEIDTIEDIELSFRIFNSDTYQTIDETDPIKFSVS